ncbi:hypothetical protein CVT24_010784 [Panaeolus cyanescens]|uniref:pyranose dehydrogenase (acceptor) n=1 Tax=Panaeolus cyanescens TaxID=181874 RepID=A0A409VGR1_9AGAR|nr:hypothetical protein CVT24_010784 [Panaeolus cyanescens]
MVICTVLSLSLFAAISVRGAIFQPYQIIEARQQNPSYDYIVVGAGIAGSTVASRLAENPSVTVLLIEAGPLDAGENFVTIPFFQGGAVGTKYDWNYTTVPQTNLNARPINIPAGKVVGGGSVLNGMIFQRGAAANYDSWEEMGNPGWNFKSLLPYFKKSETYSPPPADLAEKFNITSDPAGHGTSGPIFSTFPTYIQNDRKFFYAALNELGIPTEVDGAGSKGRALNGFWCPNTLHPTNMSRSYARTGYFNPASQKINFHVMLQQQVTKLIPKDSKKSPVTLVAVEFASSATSPRQTARATKEVIVSAGVIGSPRLLQLSGIGRKDLLQSLNIPILVDLPGVGSNYQDHGAAGVFGRFNNTPNDPAPSNPEELYLTNRTGPWTNSAPINLAFIPLRPTTAKDNADRLIKNIKSTNPASLLVPGTHSSVIAGYKKQREILAKHLSSLNTGVNEYAWGGPGGSIIVSVAHPLSRGFVEINSADPFVFPTIDVRYFSDPVDHEFSLIAFKFARRILAANVLKPFVPIESVPGASVATDDQLKAFIKNQWSTLFHSSCSNPMQPRKLGGVVDPDLKVYGTDNLRVIDASIFPLIPGSHTQATTYAVAEKGADLIKRAR